MRKQRYLRVNGSTKGKIQVLFTPDQTITCYPPYIKGQSDSCWVNKIVLTDNKTQPFNKKDCERIIGMSLQPIGGAK